MGFFLDKPALGKLLGAAKAKVGDLGSKLLPMYLFQLILVYFFVECGNFPFLHWIELLLSNLKLLHVVRKRRNRKSYFQKMYIVSQIKNAMPLIVQLKQ